MARRNAHAPLSVEVPSPDGDRPAWGKVGAIAVLGFVVGVAWPRLVGVRLGPSLPEPPASAAPSESPAQSPREASPSAPPAQPSAPAALPAAALAPAPSPASALPAAAASPPTVDVSGGTVFACKTSTGEVRKGADCGALPGLDGLVLPRLRKLAACRAASGASGVLHLIVRPDFTRDALGVDLGRSQTAANPETLLACARSALADLRAGGIAHEEARYSVSYAVTFHEPASPKAAHEEDTPAASAASAAAADGTAQVTWETAIVRDAPRTGKIVARLPHATSLRVGAAKDGWYPVKYGDGFASDGWVYRGAIGR